MVIVFANADEVWKITAGRIVYEIASRQQFLTSLEVLKELEREECATHELRALGPVMVRAAKAGAIEHYSFVRRNDKHNRGTTVQWKSLIYGKVAAVARREA
jgi:hypothetical protein